MPPHATPVVPGLVNAHTHIYSGLAPFGIPRPDPPPATFLEILERLWWRLDRALDEASLRASARYYVAESLLAGTAILIDHHESPSFIEGSLDVIADACQALGMRAVLCYGATERNGGRDEARRGLAECRRFIETNHRPLVRGVVGLHASFTVSDDTIHEAGRLCRDLGAVMHVHVAEDDADVDDARRRGYAGPFERLLALEALPAGSLLAHGVHLTRDQVARARGAGCWFVQNPRSNRVNAVGYAASLSASDRVALGTDGFPSNLVDEVEALDALAREHDDDLERVRRRPIGSVAVAAQFFPELLVPEEDVDAVGWVRAQQTACRRRLEVDGRLVVVDGRLVTADLEAIRAEARDEAERLWARMRAL